MQEKVHFIAIGGSAMHNLAIALHRKGYIVTGSDDEIFDPAKSRLLSYNLLPETFGWFPEKLSSEINAVILGMHARSDNPELQKAKELGLKIYSYPEFLYEQSKDKLRIVIGGSHGKTTITAMILHVLQSNNIDCDYMVGAKLEGFDVMVKLTKESGIMVFEGDEYLTSALDLRPKFHLYQPTIALVSGIAWDHMNVFKTFGDYIKQFDIFLNMVPENGTIVYCEADAEVKKIVDTQQNCLNKKPYGIPNHKIENGITYLITEVGDVQLQVFGGHNLMNIEGARLVCNQIGISDAQFYAAISGFKGASNRLEVIFQSEKTIVYRDFAHAPSKLKATINAVKNQYPDRKLIACYELHTFSSLSKDFLPQYESAMDEADIAIVYFSHHALSLKKLPELQNRDIVDAFGKSGLLVYTKPQDLEEFLKDQNLSDTNLLLMSSGNYDGLQFTDILTKQSTS